MPDLDIPVIDWTEVFRQSEFLLNEFLEWHLMGHGFREGAD
jgi:hypothetical protein